ncbi:hypothetical protein ABPG74_014041 [Tetrahymena malaccensis]
MEDVHISQIIQCITNIKYFLITSNQYCVLLVGELQTNSCNKNSNKKEYFEDQISLNIKVNKIQLIIFSFSNCTSHLDYFEFKVKFKIYFIYLFFRIFIQIPSSQNFVLSQQLVMWLAA